MDHDKLSENSLWEGYNPKEGGSRGRKQSPHKIIRQEPERPQVQNIGDGTQRGEEERTKSRMQSQKEGVVARASRARE